MKIPSSRFIPVTVDLIEQIRIWRNKPRIRENMLDDTLIDTDKQLRWFEGLQKSADRHYRLFLQDDRPIGMLYFSNIESEACHWGCYIGEDAVWPGSGLILEIAALDYSFSTLNVERLVAEVFEDNRSPIQMHHIFGYQLAERSIACTTESGRQKRLLYFTYAKNDWLANRAQLLSKLPRQISEASRFIQFS